MVAFLDDVVKLDGGDETVAVFVNLPNLQVHVLHVIGTFKLSEKLDQGDCLQLLFLAMEHTCVTTCIDHILTLVRLLQVDFFVHRIADDVVFLVVQGIDVDAD
jgi:hypothetical protein